MTCPHDMRPGLYLAQTWNRPRSQWDVTRYPCGPGVLRTCLKCIRCGFSRLI